MVTVRAACAHEIEVLIEYLAQGNTLVTRLRETASGDLHDCLRVPDVISTNGISSDSLPNLLEGLLHINIVQTKETVNPYDSSEYAILWVLR